MLHQRVTIQCQGKVIDLSMPVVMGIINISPDSFYSGSIVTQQKQILDRALQFVREGASMLDLGAMSSRPGANLIPANEQLDLLIPIIRLLHNEFPDTPLSIDTMYSQVAASALDAGASIINDISGGDFDTSMWDVIVKYQIPYVLMHMRGTPADMQQHTSYSDVAVEVFDTLNRKEKALRHRGVKDIIIDPGIGFAKTINQNFELLRQLHVFNMIECPVMIGISRKSFIYKTLNITPELALNGTSALHFHCLQQGVRILRVHDVLEAMQTIQLWKSMHPDQKAYHPY